MTCNTDFTTFIPFLEITRLEILIEILITKRTRYAPCSKYPKRYNDWKWLLTFQVHQKRNILFFWCFPFHIFFTFCFISVLQNWKKLNSERFSQICVSKTSIIWTFYSISQFSSLSMRGFIGIKNSLSLG